MLYLHFIIDLVGANLLEIALSVYCDHFLANVEVLQEPDSKLPYYRQN